MTTEQAAAPYRPRHLARTVFTVFLLTFIASRVLVILIMTKKMPDLFLHMGGTHVHHLNYGIFLLSAVGAALLFMERMNEAQRTFCAVVYGFGMALTFDEFGMWLHLGGSYWQRGSFDAVIVVLSLFGMLAFMPPISRFRTRHWTTIGLAVAVTAGFYFMLFKSMKYFGNRVGPRLKLIEEAGPQ